jgi:plastocyanin
MYKFLVTASLLSTALAGGYESGQQQQQYGGGDMSSYEMPSQQGGSYEMPSQGGSYEQPAQGSYEPPTQTEPMMEQSTPCEGGGKATHTVYVGGDKLVYSPEEIWAKAGDKVWFMFLKKNHTVTQSTFDKPCVKMQGGEDSGFMPSQASMQDMSSAPKWEYVVKDEKPTWWYCKQKVGMHCGKGMAFAINPTKEKTFDMFKNMAMQQNGTMTGEQGGSYGGGQQSGGSYAPPPPAETASAPPPSYSMATGEGQQGGGGACQCSCFCGVASWPSGYGIGSSGGMPGMLPMPGGMESQSGSYSAPPSQESSGYSSGGY